MTFNKKNFNLLIKFSYEYFILLTIYIALLAPFHGQKTNNINIAHTDKETVSVITDQTNVKVGESVPVYRFNPEWKNEIGRVKVLTVAANGIIFTYDKNNFRWPMGRQGTVTKEDGQNLIVNLGANLKFSVGDTLNIFKHTELVGSATITSVSENESTAKVFWSTQADLQGLTASEFIIPTQVSLFQNSFLSTLEIMLAIFLTALYFLSYIFFKRSLYEVIFSYFLRFYKHLPEKPLFYLINLLLGIPFSWLVGSFLYYASIYFHLKLETISALDVIVFVGAIYYLYFFWSRKAPVISFWNFFQYKVWDFSWFKGNTQKIIIWFLSAIIVYAFANTLFSLLLGNLNQMLQAGWKVSGFSSDYKIIRITQDILYALTHAPDLYSTEIFFLVIRYIVWSLTIIGCLIGYGNSLFSFLWGKHVRHLDFSIMGWITNAACYGPLLGVIFYQMAPHFEAKEPIITGGPLFYLMLSLELILNLLYMASIWNLGMMFGVMSDKGVKKTYFYSVVRHPSYTLEAFMFFALELRACQTLNSFLNMLFLIFFLYYLRSEREDHFMSVANPEYLEYKKETPYKFMPGVY